MTLLRRPAARLTPRPPSWSPAPWRLRRARHTRVCGLRLRVADSTAARLLGLALLDSDRAGSGLLIPRCRSVHTFGMRFPVDLFFLDANGAVLSARRGVPPRRVISNPRAVSVLEVPARGRS